MDETVTTQNVVLPYTYKLKFPIKWGESTVSEVVFARRMKAKDFKGVPAGEIKFDHMMLLVARVTATPQTLIEELDMADLSAMSEVVNSFLSSGQVTGAI